MNVIDMKLMRYINLLDGTSKVKTKNCFVYNNIIFFVVPAWLMSQAIGPNASNIRRIQEQLIKKVRIIAEPRGQNVDDVSDFIKNIVAPIKFRSLEMKDGLFVLNAGSTSKAALIGRNKKRLEELKQIVMNNFGLDLKIV